MDCDGIIERERRTLTGNVRRCDAKGQNARFAHLYAPGDGWLVALVRTFQDEYVRCRLSDPPDILSSLKVDLEACPP